MRKYKRGGGFLLALAAPFLAERGLDVSGYENLTLAYALWASSGLVLLAGAGMWLWSKFKGKDIRDAALTQVASAATQSQAINISAGGDVAIGDIGVASQPQRAALTLEILSSKLARNDYTPRPDVTDLALSDTVLEIDITFRPNRPMQLASPIRLRWGGEVFQAPSHPTDYLAGNETHNVPFIISADVNTTTKRDAVLVVIADGEEWISPSFVPTIWSD